MAAPDVFLDTSAWIAGILSASGGARALFGLGESRLMRLWCSQDVIQELEVALKRKAPAYLPEMAELLVRVNANVAAPPSTKTVRILQRVVQYSQDAVVIAAAAECGVSYLISLDRQHIVGNPALAAAVKFVIGTPGDCLAWYRARTS